MTLALVRGKSRSHDAAFSRRLRRRTGGICERQLARTNSEGKTGRVKFTSASTTSIKMKETTSVVRRAVAAVTGAGAPNVRAANGGLDAN